MIRNNVRATGERSARGRPIAARLMAPALRIFSHIHLFVYRRTGGAIAGRIFGNPVLLLTTTGRKTGKKRTTPLAYLNDDDTMIIIGGSAGAVEHPAWWLNLQANPEAEVQVGRRALRVRATEATQQEQQRLWSRYPSMQARFAFMQRLMSRKIPVIVLHPLPSLPEPCVLCRRGH